MFLNNAIFHFYVGGSGDSHVQAQILTSKRMSSSAFLTNNKCQTNTGVGGQVLQGPDHQPWAWLKLYILIIFSVFRDSFFIMVSRRLRGGKPILTNVKINWLFFKGFPKDANDAPLWQHKALVANNIKAVSVGLHFHRAIIIIILIGIALWIYIRHCHFPIRIFQLCFPG